ncbi:MAG TPA: 3-isopropylmalate dehydratase [Candidatus Bilamarchaeum sp.]|nr:3-isopropylmalate dehydratase [Candidatus Bilamarchaeum sp.]
MIWKFPDNINTDFISPARYNLASSLDANAKELAKIAFVEYRPEFPKNVKEGDIIVAGENFGCGSSRESAVVALQACGIKAILAKSFARIFFRNAINIGMRCIAIDTSGFEEGDEIEIDSKKNVVRNRTRGIERGYKEDELTKKILAEGGIISFIQKNGTGSLERLL